MLQRAAEPVDGPGHHHIHLAANDGGAESVIGRASIAPLGAADTAIDILLGDLPPHASGDAPQLVELIVRRLLSRRDPRINGNLFHHAKKHIPKTDDFGTLPSLSVTP